MRLVSFAIVGIFAFFATACGGAAPQLEAAAEAATPETHVGCEACTKGMAGETVWCDHCNAGFVEGKKVTCKTCFDHTTAGGPACEDCAKKKAEAAAAAKDEPCADCPEEKKAAAEAAKITDATPCEHPEGKPCNCKEGEAEPAAE